MNLNKTTSQTIEEFPPSLFQNKEALHTSKRKAPDLVLFFLVLMLLAIGIVMVFSASTGLALAITKNHPNPYYFLKRQVLWLVLSFLGMAVAYKINLQALKKFIPWLFVLANLSLFAVLIPGIGLDANGSRRWFHIAGMGLQPAEFSKVVLIFFTAWFLTRKGKVSTSFIKTTILLLTLVFPMIALVFKEPDFGTAFLMFATVFGMLWIAGIPWGQIIAIFSLCSPAGVFFMLKASYRLKRWMAFFNPWKDPFGAGYHIIQGLIALGSGGFLGLGLGASRQKFFYLPEQHTDYIFAILGEEGGFLAAFFVLLLFLFVAARGIRIALKQRDPYRKILAGGLTISLVGQAFLNIAMVVQLLPPVGIALPFLSYGGSSLFASMVIVGLLLNLSKVEPEHKVELDSAFGILSD
jgi:cell division protein FtsW